MTRLSLKTAASAGALVAVISVGLLVRPQPGVAQDVDTSDTRSAIGLKVAPVPLNMDGKKKALVGLGSYLVNVTSDCNGCHTKDPSAEYVFGGVPFFGQHPTKVDPTTYLGGGNDFGQLIPGSVEVVSRNITPDKDGKPAGMTFDEFQQVIRTGVDGDKWHPTCVGAPGPHCIPAPFDGSLLLIMPWPAFQNMTDHELRAVYTYLSAIPCLEGDPGNPAGEDTLGKRCK